MASSTACGFWAEAPLSRYTSGFPLISCARIGKSRRMASTSNAEELVLFTTDKSVMPSGLLKGLLEEIVKPCLGRFAHGFHRNLLHQLVDKRHGQQHVGLPAADTARHQVKHRGLIQLANGGAVGTLDVVCVDFQFRLGVDFGTVGKQQVLVIHIRIGLLGVLVDMNAAIEDSVGLVRSDVVVGLFAVAMGGYVVNRRVVVVVLFALGNHHAIELGFRAFTFQANLQVMPAQRAAEAYAVAFETGTAVLQNAGSTNVLDVFAFHIQANAGDVGAVGQGKFGDGVDQHLGGAAGNVFFNQRHLAVGTGFHVDARVGGAACVSGGFMDNKQWLVEHGAGLQANKQAVLETGAIYPGKLGLVVIQGAAQLQ